MAFKLKTKNDIFNLHHSSEFGKPVILKDDLEKGIEGEANRDGTIFVNSKMSDKKIEEAVNHEKVHLDQMAQGRLHYDDNKVTWKMDTKSPARVYKRVGGQLIDEETGESAQEGGDFEWEREAYKKQ